MGPPALGRNTDETITWVEFKARWEEKDPVVYGKAVAALAADLERESPMTAATRFL